MVEVLGGEWNGGCECVRVWSGWIGKIKGCVEWAAVKTMTVSDVMCGICGILSGVVQCE